MREIWKEVKGYEGLYEVSNLGRVKSLSRLQKHRTGTTFMKNERIVKITPAIPQKKSTFSCYHQVRLEKDDHQVQRFVHRLIASAFIDNPLHKPEVNHKNGIKTDNRIENLEWVTRSENVKHSFAIGLQSNKGVKHPLHKLTENEVLEIRQRYANGESSWQIYKSMDMSYTNIKDIIAKRTWAHL